MTAFPAPVRIHLSSPIDAAAMEGLDMAGLGIVGTRLGLPNIDANGRSIDGSMSREQSI